MVALGAAAEGARDGITGNALWPATIIESLASENFELGDKWQWRKATILSDAVMQLMGDAQTTVRGRERPPGIRGGDGCG